MPQTYYCTQQNYGNEGNDSNSTQMHVILSIFALWPLGGVGDPLLTGGGGHQGQPLEDHLVEGAAGT